MVSPQLGAMLASSRAEGADEDEDDDGEGGGKAEDDHEDQAAGLDAWPRGRVGLEAAGRVLGLCLAELRAVTGHRLVLVLVPPFLPFPGVACEVGAGDGAEGALGSSRYKLVEVSWRGAAGHDDDGCV